MDHLLLYLLLKTIVDSLKRIEDKMSQLSEKLAAIETSMSASFAGVSEDIQTLLANQQPTTDPEALAAAERLSVLAEKFAALDAQFPSTPPPTV